MQNSRHIAIIVDADKDSAEALATTIRQKFEMQDVHIFASAEVAISSIATLERLDWLFFDSEIPDINCFDFINQLRGGKGLENVKYILLSQSRNREILMQASSVGIHEVLLKPFSESTIVTKVTKLAQGRRRRQNERVKFFETINVGIEFESKKYSGSLVDLSESGCLIKSEVFDKCDAMIYQPVKITVSEDEQIIVNTEMIRLERDVDSDKRYIYSAYLFDELNQVLEKKLKNFLSHV